MRTLSITSFFVTTLALGVYLYFIFVGVEVVTSIDAFAIPAMDQPFTMNEDRKTELFIDITPAPWPTEARLIYRLASIGIPVRIVIPNENKKQGFVVDRVNAQGHLVVFSESKVDALSLLVFLGYKSP